MCLLWPRGERPRYVDWINEASASATLFASQQIVWEYLADPKYINMHIETLREKFKNLVLDDVNPRHCASNIIRVPMQCYCYRCCIGYHGGKLMYEHISIIGIVGRIMMNIMDQ